MESEFLARKWYIVQAQEINSKMQAILGGEPNTDSLFLAASPTLDNNIWGTYPEAASLLSKKIHGLPKRPKASINGIPWEDFRYSTAGLVFETLSVIFTRSWEAHFPERLEEEKVNSPILGFTFSDVDPTSNKFFERSRIWGELPSWAQQSQSIRWVGFGDANSEQNHPLVAPRKRLRIFETSTKLYFYSLLYRMRVWRKMKNDLSGVELFRTLRKQFRRSVLGAPALEAMRLTEAFENLISVYSPKSVLLPYENQLWQRVLIRICHSRGIRVVGAMHTTARFWDVRFLYAKGFSTFFPSSFVTNGRAAEELLLSLKVPKESIISGTALRFSHLRNPMLGKLPGRNCDALLVVTGIDKVATEEMITAIQNMSILNLKKLLYRPHPATTSWFRRKYPHLILDDSDFGGTLVKFDSFICDSMSSLAFEFAACTRRVFIYKPKGAINFSPLAMVRTFSSYFHDEASFAAIRHLRPTRIALTDFLNVGQDEIIWDAILQNARQ